LRGVVPCIQAVMQLSTRGNNSKRSFLTLKDIPGMSAVTYKHFAKETCSTITELVQEVRPQPLPSAPFRELNLETRGRLA
jgi:hypothetical protein